MSNNQYREAIYNMLKDVESNHILKYFYVYIGLKIQKGSRCHSD